MGPPWQIPMEFPLFQWISAHLTNPLFSLEDTSRALSLVFFVFSALVLRKLAIDLDLKKQVATAACCLFLTSPLALSYGFSATIEHLALLLALLSLWASVRWLRHPSLISLGTAVLCGIGAALAKSTTWAVFAAAIFVLFLWAFGVAPKQERSRGDILIATLLVLGTPLACGFAWVQYSDSIKALNPLTLDLCSKNLNQWNFGALALRWSLSGWVHYLVRSALLILGPLGLLLTPLAAYRWMRQAQLRPPLPVSSAAITALIVGPLILTNLYFQHDYYALTGSIFAILLFAQILFFKRERPVLLLALLISNLGATGGFIALKQANYIDPSSDGLAKIVSELPPSSSIIIFGSYLDARIPYESQFRALQTRIRDPRDPRLQDMVERMRNHETRAVICRAPGFEIVARSTARKLGLDLEKKMSPGLRIWISSKDAPLLDLEPLKLEKLAADLATGFFPPQRKWSIFLLPSGPESAPGLGLDAYGNLYLFDIRRGLRIIHHRWAPKAFLAEYDAASSFSRASPGTS